MAFIPVTNTVEAQIRMTLDNQQIENTLYFTNTDLYTATEMTVLGNDLLDWWTDQMAQNLSDDVTLREIYLVDLRTETGFTVTVPSGSPAPTGVNSGGAVPSNAAMCVSFRTDLRGRSYRGRNYISGIPASEVTLNTVSPTRIAGLIGSYELLFGFLLSNGWSWSVVSRRHNGADRITGVPTQVTSVVVVDATIDSQRRRLPGRGS